MYLEDEPICKEKDDSLKRNNFSKKLAKSISNYLDINNQSENGKPKPSLVIGLNGKWGYGKTSILNLLKEYYAVSKELYKKENNEECPLIIFKFNPWIYSSHEHLVKIFFNELGNSIINSGKLSTIDKGKFKVLNKINGIKLTLDVKKTFFSSISFYANLIFPIPIPKPEYKDIDNSEENKIKELDNLKGALNDIFKELKILCIMDDIDRLTDKEIANIFKLVKETADFKNMVYLMSFDKDIITTALNNVQKGNGSEYLNKIVNVPFDVPIITKKELKKEFLKEFVKEFETEFVNKFKKKFKMEFSNDVEFDSFKGIFDKFNGNFLNSFVNECRERMIIKLWYDSKEDFLKNVKDSLECNSSENDNIHLQITKEGILKDIDKIHRELIFYALESEIEKNFTINEDLGQKTYGENHSELRGGSYEIRNISKRDTNNNITKSKESSHEVDKEQYNEQIFIKIKEFFVIDDPIFNKTLKDKFKEKIDLIIDYDTLSNKKFKKEIINQFEEFYIKDTLDNKSCSDFKEEVNSFIDSNLFSNKQLNEKITNQFEEFYIKDTFLNKNLKSINNENYNNLKFSEDCDSYKEQFELFDVVFDLKNFIIIFYQFLNNENVIDYFFKKYTKFKNEPKKNYIASFLDGFENQYNFDGLEKEDVTDFLNQFRLKYYDYDVNQINYILIPEKEFGGGVDQENTGIIYFFNNVRDIKRYFNILKFNLSVVTKVNFKDFLIITAIQLFKPEIYHEIKKHERIFTKKYIKTDIIENNQDLNDFEIIQQIVGDNMNVQFLLREAFRKIDVMYRIKELKDEGIEITSELRYNRYNQKFNNNHDYFDENCNISSEEHFKTYFKLGFDVD